MSAEVAMNVHSLGESLASFLIKSLGKKILSKQQEKLCSMH